MRVRKKEGVIDLGCYFLEHLLLTIIDAVLRRDRMARFGMTFSDSGASDGIDWFIDWFLRLSVTEFGSTHERDDETI